MLELPPPALTASSKRTTPLLFIPMQAELKHKPPVNSQPSTDEASTALLKQFGGKSYTRAPWQQMLREGEKVREESKFFTWVPVWVIAAFLLKQSQELGVLTGCCSVKHIVWSVELNVLRRTEINPQYFSPAYTGRDTISSVWSQGSIMASSVRMKRWR